MAYSRYSTECNWYIFWERSAAVTPTAKEEERLAVWHAEHRKEGPSFTLTQIEEMLSARDYSRIPGYEVNSLDLIEAAFREFVSDVKAEYETAL